MESCDNRLFETPHGPPGGFGDLGRMAILGALVIIFRDLGSKLIVLRI